jgi:hypothetical protein
MHKEGLIFVSCRAFLWPGFMLVPVVVSGQRSDREEKKPDANDQRPEIEGEKRDEVGETPSTQTAAA